MIKKSLIRSLAFVAGITLAPGVFATNGYFAHGYGNKSKGMAGAGVALPQDAMAAATNPAGMAFVGTRFDLGLAALRASVGYSASGASGPLAPPAFNLENGAYESDNTLFFVPHLAYNRMLDADQAIGVAVYANGVSTKYPAGATPSGLGTFYGGTAGIDLSQIFIVPTYAVKLTPTAAVGISPILVYQRFKAYGLSQFGGFSTDAGKLSDNGYDTSTGVGLRLGGQMDASPNLSLGASYQTRTAMSKFDKYAGLFAEGGDLDVPPSAVIGAAFKLAPGRAIVFDVQRIEYSKVKSLGNPMNPSLAGCAGGNAAQCLGGNDGSGFGWRDMTIYKVGYQQQWSAQTAWRLGYSKANQPVPESEVLFNILAPIVTQEHYTLGWTWTTGGGEINLEAMYAPKNTVRGNNPLAAGNQTIELSMKQYELELSWAWKF